MTEYLRSIDQYRVVRDNLMVMEKEFSSNNAHVDEIHGVLKYDNQNENENVVYTCSRDQTFKKWDF